MNEMSIIDESQEKTDLINNNLPAFEQNDKENQTIQTDLIKGFDNTVNVEQDRKDHLNKMESNYKIVHKEENSKLLDFIKNKIKIPSKSLSIHDSFINIYCKSLGTLSILNIFLSGVRFALLFLFNPGF